MKRRNAFRVLTVDQIWRSAKYSISGTVTATISKEYLKQLLSQTDKRKQLKQWEAWPFSDAKKTTLRVAFCDGVVCCPSVCLSVFNRNALVGQLGALLKTWNKWNRMGKMLPLNCPLKTINTGKTTSRSWWIHTLQCIGKTQELKYAKRWWWSQRQCKFRVGSCSDGLKV